MLAMRPQGFRGFGPGPASPDLEAHQAARACQPSPGSMAGEPGLLILISAKPWSEWPEGTPAATVADTWRRQGALQAADALQRNGLQDNQYLEFVTARCEKAGQDALAKPRDALREGVPCSNPKRAGSLAKLTLRPVRLPIGAKASRELMAGVSVDLHPAPSGGAALLLPGFNLRDFPPADPTQSHRPDSRFLPHLFPIPTAAERVALALEGAAQAAQAECNRRQVRAPLWIRQAGHLAFLCREASDPSPTQPAQGSTHWNFKRLRYAARPSNPEGLLGMGCKCADPTFAQFLAQDCPVGMYRLTRGTALTVPTALHTLRHDSRLTLVTFLQTTGIQEEDIFRGFISPDSPEVFQVATDLPWAEGRNRNRDPAGAAWSHSDRYKAAFLISCAEVGRLNSQATPTTEHGLDLFWMSGALVLLTAAPQSSRGRWRMTLCTPSPIHGDTVLVMLPWIGNQLFYHEALRQAWNKQPGGSPALLHLICCLGRLEPINPPPGLAISRHILQGHISPTLVRNHQLRTRVCLDQDQLSAMIAINAAPTPLVCIHAMAGAGKSMVGCFLLRDFLEATRNTPERPQIALWIVPTQALQDQVVGSIQQQGLLEPEEVHWLGRPINTSRGKRDAEEILLERVYSEQGPARGHLADVQASLEKALTECQEEQPYSSTFWNKLAAAKELAATYVQDEVMLIIRTFDELLQRHMQVLRLVILTADAAAKVFAGLHPGILGRLLRTSCDCVLGIIDEAQKAEVLCGASLLAHLSSAVVLVDPHAAWFLKHRAWTVQPWTDQLEPMDQEFNHPHHRGIGPGPASPAPLTESAFQRNPTDIYFSDLLDQECGITRLKMSLCHRCGPQVCRYLSTLFPSMHADFQAAPDAPDTQLLHVWYWPLWRAAGFATARQEDAPVAWEPRLFRAIGAMALQQLMHLESDFDAREAAGGQPWDNNAVLVLVACYLPRVARPLGWFFQELIGTARALGLLRHTQVSNAPVRVPDTLCGLTSEHTHVLLHRRTCRVADMHRGIQHSDKRYYVAVSRAKRTSTIWLDAEPFGTPDRPLDSHVPSPLVAAKKFHENIRSAVWSHKLSYQHLWPNDGPLWDHNLKLPTWIAQHFAHGEQLPARCALDKAGDSWQTCPPQEVRQCRYFDLQAALTDRAVAKLATCALEEAHQSGSNAPHGYALLPLAELVSDAWPALAAEGFKLGNILVDGIVVKKWGKQGLQLSIPCIYMGRGQEWPRLGNSPVKQGEPMVQALVALSWVVHSSATRETGLRLVSKMHQAEVVDVTTPGWSWWSRKCETDQQAILLTDSISTGAEGAHMHAYMGGGRLSSASTDLLQSIVVRTRNWESGAAVMAAASGNTSRRC